MAVTSVLTIELRCTNMDYPNCAIIIGGLHKFMYYLGGSQYLNV
jgi:hypothetical protein